MPLPLDPAEVPDEDLGINEVALWVTIMSHTVPVIMFKTKDSTGQIKSGYVQIE